MEVKTLYIESSQQAADIFTKAFLVPETWNNLCRLVGVSSKLSFESVHKQHTTKIAPCLTQHSVAISPLQRRPIVAALSARPRGMAKYKVDLEEDTNVLTGVRTVPHRQLLGIIDVNLEQPLL